MAVACASMAAMQRLYGIPLRAPRGLSARVWGLMWSAPVGRRRMASRLAAWFAILAMLMSALAPTVSRVVAAERSTQWVEICTAMGMTRMLTDADGEPVPNPAQTVVRADCPYCALSVVAPPPPPAGALPSPAKSAHVESPPRNAFAPPALALWRIGPPRAPPAIG